MSQEASWRFSPHFAGTVLLLSGALAASVLTANRRSEDLAQPLDTIGQQISGFKAVAENPLEDRILEKLTPTSYLSRTYSKAGLNADLFIAYYAQQRAGESMHSPKHCLPGAGWEIWDYGTTDLVVNGSSITVNRYSVSREGRRMLVLYWYQSRNRIIASEYKGKFLLARDALLQNSTAGSIVRIVVPDQPGALAEARDFGANLIAQLRRCFGE